MEEQRYYIAVDENGEAYIEHGLFDRARSTGQRAHKYLMKIGEGAKARYLYTQEEVRAYMQGGQKRNPNIKRPEDFEIRARRPDSAPNKMQQTKSSGIKRPEDFEIRARRPENVSSKTAEKTGQSVKDTVKKVVETVKDKAGVDERQRAEEAWSKVPKQLSSKDEKGMQAFKEANKAQDEYRKTPLGKAEYLTERAQEIATGVDGSAKDIAKKVGSTVKSKTDRMKEEFRKKKDEVADKLGFDERRRLKEAEDYRDRTQNLGRSDNVIKRTPDGAIDFSANAKQQEKAQKDVENRRDDYHDTPIGRVAKLKEDAEDAIDEAKRKTNKKVEELKSQLKEQIEKIDRERDFKNAPKTFSKMIKENAKNLGISEDEAKERLIEWTTEYYTNTGDLERRDRYLEALRKA